MDGSKLMNGSENIFFRRDASNLMFEHRPVIGTKDTLFVRVSNMKQSPYRLAIEGTNLATDKTEALLIDRYTKKETTVDLASTQEYDFSVTADSTSTGDRFQIVFTKAASHGGGTAEPAEAGRMNPYPNPVVSGVPVRVDIDGTKAPWSLRLLDAGGRTVWRQTVKNPGQRRVDIDMSRMATGVYQLFMTDGKGTQSVSRLLKQ
jgi:hypothetical protein